MRVLRRFDRQALASFITVAIEVRDVVEGDCDLEPDDEPEDDDPGGGNVTDEPHDGDGILTG
jgi:hypothetical protein